MKVLHSVECLSKSLKSGKRSSDAFTLIELVLVITIISVLVGGGIYYMMGNVDVAKETKVQTDLKVFETQLKVYEARNSRAPTTDQGLMALVEQPDQDPAPENWVQLLEELPKDPWGNDYKYRYPAEVSKKPYDIFSFGKDGVESDDDIGNWKKVATKK